MSATKQKADRAGRRAAGSLYQKTDGGVWYIRVTIPNADGGSVRKVYSTCTTDRTEAEVALRRRVTDLGLTQLTEAERLAALAKTMGDLSHQQEIESRKALEENSGASRLPPPVN